MNDDVEFDSSPSTSRKLRDAYEMLDFLDGESNAERRKRHERCLNMPLDYVPFGEHEIGYRNDDDNDVNFTRNSSRLSPSDTSQSLWVSTPSW